MKDELRLDVNDFTFRRVRRVLRECGLKRRFLSDEFHGDGVERVIYHKQRQDIYNRGPRSIFVEIEAERDKIDYIALSLRKLR